MLRSIFLRGVLLAPLPLHIASAVDSIGPGQQQVAQANGIEKRLENTNRAGGGLRLEIFEVGRTAIRGRLLADGREWYLSPQPPDRDFGRFRATFNGYDQLILEGWEVEYRLTLTHDRWIGTSTNQAQIRSTTRHFTLIKAADQAARPTFNPAQGQNSGVLGVEKWCDAGRWAGLMSLAVAKVGSNGTILDGEYEWKGAAPIRIPLVDTGSNIAGARVTIRAKALTLDMQLKDGELSGDGKFSDDRPSFRALLIPCR